MKVIRPTVITDPGVLVSSNAPQPGAGEIEWVSGTPGVVGDIRLRSTTRRLYRCFVGGGGASPPEVDVTRWEDFGPSNRYAAFDSDASTQTILASPLTIVLDPGVCDSLALLELVGDQVTVTVTEGAAGPVLYTRTESLELSPVADWYGYYYEPFTQRTSVVLLDLPPATDARITITLTGGSTVRMGFCIVGNSLSLGSTEGGVSAGIRDYSRKVVDEETGVVTLEQRKFRKLMNARMLLDGAEVNYVQQLLQTLRATPVLWVGDESGQFDALVVFGFYRDMRLNLQGPTEAYYTLEIEGMI